MLETLGAIAYFRATPAAPWRYSLGPIARAMAEGKRVQLPLAERLRPKRLGEIVGNPQARSDLRSWAERWLAGVPAGHRAALLIGPPGVGKTTAAAALANEFGWGFVEMNASDARNQSSIEQIAGRASISQGLDAGTDARGPRRTLILLDEADCLSGRASDSAKPVREPLSLREFLQRRYPTVESLNKAWGLTESGKTRAFPDWGSVPRTPGRHAWAALAPARKDIEEWRAAGVVADVSDRGGLATIAKLVRSTRQPIVLTVNDDRPLTRYSPVFRSQVTRIRFYPLRDGELNGRLASVARSEAIALAPGVLEAIVGRSRGDLRAALNDLDAIAPLPAGPAQREALGTRDLSSDFAQLTTEALSRPRYYRSVEIQDRLDATPDDLLPWVEENIDRFAADPARRSAGFSVLSVAELFLARARRARVYGLWSYASELLSGGVGLAIREGPPSHPIEAQFPQFLFDMGRSRAYRALRKTVALKLGRRFHVSERKAVLFLLPFVDRLLVALVADEKDRRARKLACALVHELALTSEELAFLLGDRGDADLVEELLADPVPEPSGKEADPGSSARTDDPEPRAEPAARKAVQRSLGEFGRG